MCLFAPLVPLTSLRTVWQAAKALQPPSPDSDLHGRFPSILTRYQTSDLLFFATFNFQGIFHTGDRAHGCSAPLPIETTGTFLAGGFTGKKDPCRFWWDSNPQPPTLEVNSNTFKIIPHLKVSNILMSTPTPCCPCHTPSIFHPVTKFKLSPMGRTFHVWETLSNL